MRPHQKLILVEQYGAGTFMIPDDMQESVESNRTLAVVKHILTMPPEHQNGPYLEERSHLGEGGARALLPRAAAAAAAECRSARAANRAPRRLTLPAPLVHLCPAALMAPQVENAERLLTYRAKPWSEGALGKMEALLPMTVRFSDPLQCGGSWGFVRYHGFFT